MNNSKFACYQTLVAISLGVYSTAFAMPASAQYLPSGSILAKPVMTPRPSYSPVLRAPQARFIPRVAQSDLGLRPPIKSTPDSNASAGNTGASGTPATSTSTSTSASGSSNPAPDSPPETNNPMSNGNEFAGNTEMNSIPGIDQIRLRDIELVRRDLTSLANRHQLPPPDPGMTRQQLGKYFFDLISKLSNSQEQFSEQDYNDIGILTDEFDDVLRRVKGRLALSVLKNEFVSPQSASTKKTQELDSRLAILEKVKLSGDFTFAPQSDFGRRVSESTATNFRGRINVLAKVYESKPDAKIGDATLFMRLTGASGRFFPRDKYLMSPTNDLNDQYANPFNSGVADVQVPNLQINNNNSNNVRPTVSFEQMYYSQELRPAKDWRAKYQIGLNNLGNMMDSNNYANNETYQFLNTQFVNSVAFKPNFIGPSSVFSLERGILRDKAFLRATSAMISLSDRDYFGGFGTVSELQLGQKFFKKEGNIRAGYWNFNFRGGSARPLVTPTDTSPPALLSILPGGTNQGSQPTGMYLNFDQKIWKDIGLWGRYALSDKQFGQVFLGGLLTSRQSFSFGAEIPAKLVLKKRPDDVLGIAYGQISSYRRGTITPSTPAFVGINGVPATTLDEVNANLATLSPGTRPAQEKCFEAYYRWQVNKNVSVSPDFQYIWAPGATAGGNPGICVLGTRLNVVF